MRRLKIYDGLRCCVNVGMTGVAGRNRSDNYKQSKSLIFYSSKLSLIFHELVQAISSQMKLKRTNSS